MDKLDNFEDAEEFLRGLGLHVDEGVVRQVMSVLSCEAHEPLYSLYATRPGMPPPICGKGTVYKIKRLYDKGKLKPYLDYLSDPPTIGEAKAEQIKEAEHDVPKKSRTEQVPYEETPHKQNMRELAKKLAKISLPSVMDSFKISQGELGSYSLLANDDVFFIMEFENREIAAFAELEGTESTDYGDAEANFAWKALLGHLETGGFLGVIDKIKYFKPKMDAYFECCHEFLKLVEKRIEDDTNLLVPSNYSEAFGFTPFFAILICVDAVQTYDGLSFIKDSSYRIEEKGSDWVLTCDWLVISIDDSKETLSNYEKMHKDLRLEWTSRDKREQIEAITGIRKDLEDTVKEVRKDLFTFAGKGTLPGHCELY